MQLQLGDLLSDERSAKRTEWRVIGYPYTTGGGKTVHVRVESVQNPGVTQMRAWEAHELLSVRR